MAYLLNSITAALFGTRVEGDVCLIRTDLISPDATHVYLNVRGRQGRYLKHAVIPTEKAGDLRRGQHASFRYRDSGFAQPLDSVIPDCLPERERLV